MKRVLAAAENMLRRLLTAAFRRRSHAEPAPGKTPPEKSSQDDDSPSVGAPWGWHFLAMIALATQALLAAAGCAAKPDPPLVAMLLYGEFRQPVVDGLTDGLASLGLVEGTNVRYCIVNADSDESAIEKHARQLVAMRPAVICATGGAEADSAVAAAMGTGIPVVFIGVSSPIERGLARNFLHPIPGTTGVRSGFSGLIGKRLQLIKLIMPDVSTATVLYNPRNVPSALSLERGMALAGHLGLRLRPVAVATDDDIEQFIDSLPADHEIILGTPAEVIFKNRASAIVPGTLAAGVPFVAFDKEACDEGAPFAYGPGFRAMGYQAATMVLKVLRGTKPEEIPIERPSDIGLTINLTTANSLGIPMPPQVLGIADTIVN